jgi:hypothetical protein
MAHEPIHEMAGFCHVLATSGLLGSESIDDVVGAFRERARTQPNKYGTSLTAFTTYLIAEGKLTCWQCAKLRSHQYKGFFFEQYRIVDQLPFGDGFSRFVAEDAVRGRVVVLCVRPPGTQPEKHWIDDFEG